MLIMQVVNQVNYKLEYIIQKAVFLAPKVYGLVTTEGEEILKVKGVSADIVSTMNLTSLSKLLIQGESIIVTQEKWFKNIQEGDISVNEIVYTLKVTTNKREAIYIDGVYENTRPYYYDEI